MRQALGIFSKILLINATALLGGFLGLFLPSWLGLVSVDGYDNPALGIFIGSLIGITAGVILGEFLKIKRNSKQNKLKSNF